MTVITNEKNELVLTRPITGWRVCIDYRKLNDATWKDHFPLPFIDQMLERLPGNEYYCFLDGFSGYFQIPIAPEDQEKTTFTCPYGTFAYRRMPFGLCNAPATFQRCMTTIFHDMCKDFMEVFMDDFSVFGNSFDSCLTNLSKMSAICEETNLVLNWEKCQFMVKEEIVLGYKNSSVGIEVDKEKVDVIAKLSYPINSKGIRSFLGHAGFYRRFTKDFFKIARPMIKLLMKETKFNFSEDCIKAFNIPKKKLTTTPVIIASNWNLDFELMCDASNYVVGAMLGQRFDKKFQPIYYASKTMNDAQEHYTTTEKELLVVVYAFNKVWSYLVMSKTIVYTGHSTLKIKKGAENLAVNHLSRLENPELKELDEEVIRDSFPNEHLMAIQIRKAEKDPSYADYANILVSNVMPKDMTYHLKKKFFSDLKYYIWDEPYLFKSCPEGIIRSCVFGKVLQDILEHCHMGPPRGHYGAYITARKVLKKDSIGPPSSRMLKVFDIWGIDFMGPFPSSRNNKYILVVVDYVSKWVETKALPTNDAQVVVKFLRKLFSRFGVPKALISDRGTRLCNSHLEKTLKKYGVTHRLTTPYHSRTSGKTENTNQTIKRILERTVNGNRKEWADKLDEAL
ncbi:putative nucleotidyltransferase, ribonuclease H [Tanacetum coccineum]|uniref:Nucleotidyltransferase, ribonuclease H n=1 Tax=Tanacetum coccineum TaxID=301880 RepID=A0ABQ5G796_9ASTR